MSFRRERFRHDVPDEDEDLGPSTSWGVPDFGDEELGFVARRLVEEDDVGRCLLEGGGERRAAFDALEGDAVAGRAERPHDDLLHVLTDAVGTADEQDAERARILRGRR